MLRNINKTIIKISILFIMISCMCSCKGMFEPMTADFEVPEGPPEYRAGWHDGCSTALSAGGFTSGKFHKLTFGGGTYTHDPAYQGAWTAGWYACVTQAGDYQSLPGMNTAPFD
jgi:hypothetical protein